MEINFKEKLAICMSVNGPRHRQLALERLLDFELYPDLDNLYFFITTDKVEYFKGVNRKNLIVKDLKDFYKDHPEVEKNEAYFDWDDDEDIEGYGKKFNEINWKWSANIQRFHLKTAIEQGVTNVGIFCTDAFMFLDRVKDSFLNQDRNLLYWTGGGGHHEGIYCERDEKFQKMIDNAEILGSDFLACRMKNHAMPVLEELGLTCDEKVMVYDGAAQLYSFKNIESMSDYFDLWNYATKRLFETGGIVEFNYPSWIYTNDYLIPPLLNASNIESGPDFFASQNQPHLEQEARFIMRVRHDWDSERPWTEPQDLKPGDRKWNPDIQNWEIIGS